MDGDTFDFLTLNNTDEFKDFKDPGILEPSNVMITQPVTDNSQPITCVQQDVASAQNRLQRVSVASTPTVFNSQYTIPPSVSFNVQPPVVTLAPVVPQQRQLILPAKIIKSESLVYSRGTQAVTSTSLPHQIRTLVNTANGTVLATGT